MYRILLIQLLLYVSTMAWSNVQITELTPCNYSTYLNTDNYNFSGYIEFYNDGDSTNLKGCVLTHYKLKKKGKYELKWQWEVDQNCALPKNVYSVLWMDETEAKNHCPYKLDSDGGYVILRRDGVLLDSIAYGALTANISYGRYDGSCGYMEPTPYLENTSSVSSVTKRCAKPSFSEAGGVKSSSVSVTLSAAEGESVYYTLNGQEPTIDNGMLYDSPIEIAKNTTLRAKSFGDGKLSSQVASTTYIFEDKAHATCGGFSLPIVALSVDSSYFYDNTIGICVKGTNGIVGEKNCQPKANYNQDWKRPVHFEYIVDGQPVFSQDVEAAVEGGCSRTYDIKSLSLKATSKTGLDEMDYHFFSSKPDVTHQTVHVRNGGTAYNKVPFRDGLMQTFAKGMNIDYQAYQPVAYYINGKYQRLMALNERTNVDYITANYGYDEDEVDLITVSDQLGIRASKGDMTAYEELSSYLQAGNEDDSAFYAGACRRMDMDEYVDYQVFQQFIKNTDWPGNNTKIWREKENGRFRWILFDTDFGFHLSGYGYMDDASTNMIEWCAGTGSTYWANTDDWMTLIFRSLYQNPQFKRKFVTHYLYHLSTTFSDDHINAVFDSITALVESEYCASFGTSATDDAESMRKVALGRAEDIYSQLVSYVNGSSLISLSLNSNVEGAIFTMNGEPMEYFDGKYIAGYELDVKVYPPSGYEFAGWQFSDSENMDVTVGELEMGYNLPGSFRGTLSGDVEVVALFEKTSTEPTVVLNEICASSDSLSDVMDDYGRFPDWIEVYNYGDYRVDLAGYTLYLEKSSGKVKSSQLPYGTSSTYIEPGEHKVLWANGDAADGDLYLDFKIDVDDQPIICLQNGDFFDCVELMKHETNESYGRRYDNDSEWTLFTICDDHTTSTPSEANGSIACALTVNREVAMENTKIQIYPNPTSGSLNVASSSLMMRIEIFDAMGRSVQRVEPQDNFWQGSVSELPVGLYYLSVYTNEGVENLKFQKK